MRPWRRRCGGRSGSGVRHGGHMSGRNIVRSLGCVAALLAITAGFARAADNELTDKERADGWVLLFDGKSADQWLIGGEPIPAANVKDGAINARNVGGGRKLYVMYTRPTFADFVLACDFKLSPQC